MVGVVAFGDNVVDCYADHDVMFPGGNALNVAVFARRFGARSGYVGAVGEDAAGRHICDALLSEGVDMSHLRTLGGPTAFCLVGNRDGEREFLGADLGVSIIAPEDGDLGYMAGFDAVHTGRSSHVNDHVEAFAARTRLSFDFAVVRDPAWIGKIAPHCFLASFSAGDLSRPAVGSLCESVLAAGATWCLVTRGRTGAVLAGGGAIAEVEAADITPVDTLGAGDTFIARTLVGLLNGEAPPQVLSAAAEAAGETCTRIGAFGYPAPIDIDASRARNVEDIYASPVRPSAAGNAGTVR